MNVSYVYNTNQIIYFEEDIFKFNYISPLGIGFNRNIRFTIFFQRLLKESFKEYLKWLVSNH